jgi:two-component system NtrC family sensor kinase
VRPFTDRKIELLKTFADQAVIAIENTRLFEAEQTYTRELTEALEQQTATSEVLQVISGSPGELEPVFAAMLENAVRICVARFGNLLLYDGEKFRHIALHNTPQAWVAEQERDPVPPRDLARVLYSVPDTKGVVHISDLTAVNPNEPIATIAGARTLLIVPMLKQDDLVGVIAVYRQEVRPFTEKQIELVKSFASQAVIAIENTRLLNELRESLQQQTATSEVLEVISRSPTHVQPVFDAIAPSAVRLCHAHDAGILQLEGDRLQLVAHHGPMPTWGPVGQGELPIGRGWAAGRAFVDREPVHVRDLLAAQEDFPIGYKMALRTGQRTTLAVPLLREGKSIGCLFLRRMEMRPFSEKQIAVLQTFADQAVIAIENTRLLEEVQTRNSQLRVALEQQTATSELLKVVGRSTFDLQPGLRDAGENAVRLCEAERGFVHRFDGQILRIVAAHNISPELRAFVERNPITPGRHSVAARAALERHTVHMHNVLADPDLTYAANLRACDRPNSHHARRPYAQEW